MEVLTYQIKCLIVFSGLIAGYALCYLAPEEINPGRKWFSFFRIIIIIAMLAFMGFETYELMSIHNSTSNITAYASAGALFVYVVLAILFGFASLLRKTANTFSWLMFIMLPVFILSARRHETLALFILFGILEAPNTVEVDKKNKVRHLLRNSYHYLAYFFVAFLFSFLA